MSNLGERLAEAARGKQLDDDLEDSFKLLSSMNELFSEALGSEHRLSIAARRLDVVFRKLAKEAGYDT